MFRIELFVEDKNLAKALIGLQGMALQQPVVQPVVNANAGKNGVTATTNGSTCEMFLEHLRKTGTSRVTSGDVQQWLDGIGKSAKSWQHVVKCGKAAGFLKNHSRGRYNVVLAKGRSK